MPPTTPGTDQTINNVWGQSNLGQQVFLTLPSGQQVWARVVGLQGVLETGVMGEADSLTAFIGKSFIRRVRGAKGKADAEEVDAAKLMQSPETLKKIVKMVDALTPHVVAEPTVKCHYEVLNPGTDKEDTRMIPKEEREPGMIYTDQIGLEDKMFLFNFAMSGVKDAESFRSQSEATLGIVADGEDIPDQTQRVGGDRAERRKRPKRRQSRD